MPIALIVHGGAGDIGDSDAEPSRRACEVAATIGFQVLQQGTALDAVEAAIVAMEDNPALNAGFGSVLNQAGQVSMDASFMDGKTLDAGAVAGILHIKNPIRLARRVMESEHTFLIGEGAERFASEKGMSFVDNETLKTIAQIERWKECLAHPPAPHKALSRSVHGTVGCVALDQQGHVAAGTSTGGMLFKRVGRVGDSPLIGCGVYADDELGGASATGWGEAITRVVLSKYALDELKTGCTAQQAAQKAIEHLARKVGGDGGIILISRIGQVGFAFSTRRMAYAYIDQDRQIRSSC